MLRRVRSERGNVTILMLVITAGFLCLMAIFYDFLAVFMAKRVGQKAADAAALAAVYKWTDQTEADGEARANEVFSDFMAGMATAVETQADDWERSRVAYLTASLSLANPLMSPQEIADQVAQIIASELPLARERIRSDYIDQHIKTPDLRSALRNHRSPSPDELELEFITPVEAGCIAYEAGFKAQAVMNKAAAYYVSENGTEPPQNAPLVEYPVAFEGRTQVRTTAARRIELGVFDSALDEAHRYLQVRATVTVSWVGPVPVEWSPGCGGS